MTFAEAYHRWNTLHAAVLTLTTIATFIPEIGAFSWLAAAVWGLLSMLWLYATGASTLKEGVGSTVPNLLTAIRTIAAITLFGVAALYERVTATGSVSGETFRWWLVGVLALVETTDFFDGKIARSRGASAFGATWDMESDALFTLALSAGARTVAGRASFVLLIGAMRYLYVLIWRYDSDPPVHPPIYKLFAKTIAATIVVTLIAVLAPMVGRSLGNVALFVVLALQTTSFGWEVVLHVRANRSSDHAAGGSL